MLKCSFFSNRITYLIKRLSHNEVVPLSEILELNKVGDVVTVKGWIKSVRKQKEQIFVDLNDGSTEKKLQVCVHRNLTTPKLSTGCSISAVGSLSLSPKGQIELICNNIDVTGPCVVSEGYPFAPRKLYAVEYVRQYLHFRPRTNKFAALLRVRNAATIAIYNYFNSQGFINVHTPILTSSDCEGAGEVFKVIPESKQLLKSMLKEGQPDDEIYFNTKSFLTVSGQLHLEAAAHGLSRVYTFGPTFRAENSKSRLHLSEFYMLEAEIAFVEKLETILGFVEDLIKEVTKNLISEMSGDIERCQESKDSFQWLEQKFPILTHSEALKIVENNFAEKLNPSEGLGKEQELFLVKHCGNLPVFVINWPKDEKPFYMKENQDNTVAAFDLLAPYVGEIVGGSLRENDYDKLKLKIPHSSENFEWYLELRKFGSVPTAGFGLGFERYLQSVLGIMNIKDVIPFPRWPHNCLM